MRPFSSEYTVEIGDFRLASYHALVFRYRTMLRIAVVVMLVSLAYAIASMLGAGKPNLMVFFIGGAYMIWLLIMLAGVEKNIRSYVRQPDCLVGQRFLANFDAQEVRIRIPARKVDARLPYQGLACAFELSSLFLFYVNAEQVYMVPVRAMSRDDQVSLRAHLTSVLGDKFSSRFQGKS